MSRFDAADFARRLAALTPRSWYSDDALSANGKAYAVLSSLGAALSILKSEIDYVNLQKRIKTATDVNLDAIGVDYFGFGYARGTRLVGTDFEPETDAQFAARILADIIAPRNTLAAIASRVQNWVNAFFQAAAAENALLLGLDTQGSLDNRGALDGRPQDIPPVPLVSCFDRQSDPKTSNLIGLTTGQFCILFTYGGLESDAFFAGRAHLGRKDHIVNPHIQVIAPISTTLDAVVKTIKAEGMQPIYADNRGA